MKKNMKPKCNLIGEDGNIFNLAAIASKCLKKRGLNEEAKKMQAEIFKSQSYEEALSIIGNYVEIN